MNRSYAFGVALLRVYAAKDGQRFWLELPVTEQALEHREWVDVGARDFVRDQIRRELGDHGLPFPDDPVVLCWVSGGSEAESFTQPYVWDAWADPYHDSPPPYASSPDARLLVIERKRAKAAADTWPRELWYWHWHPSAARRYAAKSHGITAVLFNADGLELRRFRAPTTHPRLELPEARGTLFTRDPEPLGLADDGTALWGYRSAS